MPHITERYRGTSLLALTLAARLNPSSSLAHQLILQARFPSCTSFQAPPPLLLLSARGVASTRLPAGRAGENPDHTTTRRGKRRARPTWRYGNARETSAVGWSCASLGDSDVAGSNDGVASQRSIHRGSKVADPSGVLPLTHDQLPEESIYILDGTSMLFRAFYGRGAGG